MWIVWKTNAHKTEKSGIANGKAIRKVIAPTNNVICFKLWERGGILGWQRVRFTFNLKSISLKFNSKPIIFECRSSCLEEINLFATIVYQNFGCSLT